MEKNRASSVPLKRRRDSPPLSTAEDLAAAVGSLSLAGRKQESLGANKPPLFEASSSRVKELKDGLKFAIRDMESAKADLKKLADYVTRDWTIDEVVFRIYGNLGVLDTAIERSWLIFADNPPPLSEWFYDDQSSEELQSDASWADENDVDWDEIMDRRMD